VSEVTIELLAARGETLISLLLNGFDGAVSSVRQLR
jgi:hypothetical protein